MAESNRAPLGKKVAPSRATVVLHSGITLQIDYVGIERDVDAIIFIKPNGVRHAVARSAVESAHIPA